MQAIVNQQMASRTVLVTGASRGVGASIARALANAGADVIAQYRTGRAGAEQALDVLPESRRLLLSADLATPDGSRDLWRRAVGWGREIDVVVVNAATCPTTPLHGSDDEWDDGWRDAFAVNVIGAGALIREAARYFVGRGAGTIIVLSSWAAEQGSRIADLTAYAASKAAIRNLAQTLARAHARDGLRVYVVAPGVVNTGMGVVDKDKAAQNAVAEGLAMGRLVDASEVAALVVFLASDGCSSLTGATIDVNGASYIR